jgi:hypothetical protein
MEEIIEISNSDEEIIRNSISFFNKTLPVLSKRNIKSILNMKCDDLRFLIKK